MVALDFVFLCGLLSLGFFIDLKVVADEYQECFREIGGDVEFRGLSNVAAAELEVSQYGDVEVEVYLDMSSRQSCYFHLFAGNVEVRFYMPNLDTSKQLKIYRSFEMSYSTLYLPCFGRIAEDGVYFRNKSSGSEEPVTYNPVEFTQDNGARKLMIQLHTDFLFDFLVIRFKNAKIFKPQPMTTPAPPLKKSTNPLLIVVLVVVIIAFIFSSGIFGLCWYAKTNKQKPLTVKVHQKDKPKSMKKEDKPSKKS
ncbi:hypothetical protein M3Y94_01263300 [Aphelenchoides besseyi]|nr:hypothetical protein M3Y94_01263300 [Aphelenchoides besseyi]